MGTIKVLEIKNDLFNSLTLDDKVNYISNCRKLSAKCIKIAKYIFENEPVAIGIVATEFNNTKEAIAMYYYKIVNVVNDFYKCNEPVTKQTLVSDVRLRLTANDIRICHINNIYTVDDLLSLRVYTLRRKRIFGLNSIRKIYTELDEFGFDVNKDIKLLLYIMDNYKDFNIEKLALTSSLIEVGITSTEAFKAACSKDLIEVDSAHVCVIKLLKIAKEREGSL